MVTELEKFSFHSNPKERQCQRMLKRSGKREEYIASQIKDIARYRKSLLVVLEVERVDGVMGHLV